MEKYKVFAKIQDGVSLNEFKDFSDDKDVVIEAVKQSYMALKFASDRLKDDDEVVEIARSNFKKQLVYASERFQYNPKYIYSWLATELKNINCSHDLVNIITKALTELAELKGWSKNEEEGKKLLKKLEK